MAAVEVMVVHPPRKGDGATREEHVCILSRSFSQFVLGAAAYGSVAAISGFIVRVPSH